MFQTFNLPNPGRFSALIVFQLDIYKVSHDFGSFGHIFVSLVQ